MHKVVIGQNLKIGEILKAHTKGLVKRGFLITNKTVAKLHLGSLKKQFKGFELKIAILPDGERYKNFFQVQNLYKTALKSGITRKCFAVAFGGGVIGDISGFFASTYMRGIKFFQIPTTLLAMVDASIGGKTAVNMKEGKNLIGTFYMPEAVLIDVDFLKTLPEKEFKNGLAEVIKYGAMNKMFFESLKKNLKQILKKDEKILINTIKFCVNIKTEIVKRDFREKGLRQILNFGHTIGHAIESAGNYRTKHGFAVALGMIYEVLLSVYLGKCPQKVAEDFISVLNQAGFRMKELDLASLFKGISYDKKVVDINPVFVLMNEIGKLKPEEISWEVLKKWARLQRK